MSIGRVNSIAILSVFICASLLAQAPDLPDSPAGRAMAHVLGAFGEQAESLDPALFSASFLEAVPPARLQAIPAALRAQLGPMRLVVIEKSTESDLVVGCVGSGSGTHMRILLSLDADGMIEGLLLRPAPDLDHPEDSWDQVITDLLEQGDRASLAAFRLEDDQLHEHRSAGSQDPLAIGSTFKLYVLGALAEMIRDGQAEWDQTIAIREELRSLPSGTMQNDPAGTEHPISEFALNMISISDNTATDHLIDFVGRERIESYLSRFNEHVKLNRPFLSTGEMFKLKLGADPSIRERYASATEEVRRAMLDNAEFAGAPMPPLEDPVTGWTEPRMIDRIEWFATPRDCARVMVDLLGLSHSSGLEELNRVLSTNPGMPIDGRTWPLVFFKGGSEPGVVNLTWLLRRADEEIFVLVLTVNDDDSTPSPIDLASIGARAVLLLADAE